ncbi:MAG: hypothetical protein BECKG1743D_GA0114223_102144 [Candidatus Kentron sp. G]|nr:MAG: hypothetical protein BECKG1743E_GA0114224_102303 [Candidatus Kentron sp. G]VFN00648.1 MAG: hypothetical protein BECKG1743D_GA0114223_102144 [Candidatus Kentron sp. G]VFN02465.1 MAG: hypothetical protein BECKG1743F_GA0114225_106862 [Candidatus Kentron sp. G]
MKNRLVFFALTTLLLTGPAYVGTAFGVESAPRISDREIIERLTRLEEGQRSIQKQMQMTREQTGERFTAMEKRVDERFTATEKRVDERFTAMEKRVDQRFVAMEERMDQRFTAMEKRMDQRFVAMEERMDQRFAAMEKHMDLMGDQTGQQISSLEKRVDDRLDAQWNLTLILIAAIFGLIGFVVWDRKTAFKPLEKRFTRIADTIERDLEPESPEGSRFARLMNVLRELAPDDPRLANALRRHSLLEDLPRKPA